MNVNNPRIRYDSDGDASLPLQVCGLLYNLAISIYKVLILVTIPMVLLNLPQATLTFPSEIR